MAIRDLMPTSAPIRPWRRAGFRGARALCAAMLVVAATGATGARAQTVPIETELLATRRLLLEVGPGLRGVCIGPGGDYYVLSAPGAAVLIYDPSGRRIGQVPSHSASVAGNPAAIVFGESLDVDAAGRVVVADRGAGGVKVYAADGTLTAFIHVASPESVAFLEGGEGSEVAVASLSARRLITVYDTSGTLLREFGDASDLTDMDALPAPNAQAKMGVIARDAAPNVYYAFAFLPDPTVLKYDRQGYAVTQISSKLPGPATTPTKLSDAQRELMARESGGAPPPLQRVVTGMGVGREGQDLWVSAGTLLLHFDKDGNRLASYRTYTPDGGRLETTVILVEADRLLLGADPFGLYEFARPDKLTH
jgi:hypothetical protein